MTPKTYHVSRLFITFILAMTISTSISMKNFLIPAVAVIIASLVLLQLRKGVKEVIADERDMNIAGKSALLAIRVFGWISVFPILALYAFRDRNPSYEPIGITLAFSTCVLMIAYSAIFAYYNKISTKRERVLYFVFIALIAVLISVSTIRVFSGEDDWMCKDGKWVEHGHPSFPAPTEPCRS